MASSDLDTLARLQPRCGGASHVRLRRRTGDKAGQQGKAGEETA